MNEGEWFSNSCVWGENSKHRGGKNGKTMLGSPGMLKRAPGCRKQGSLDDATLWLPESESRSGSSNCLWTWRFIAGTYSQIY